MGACESVEGGRQSNMAAAQQQPTAAPQDNAATAAALRHQLTLLDETASVQRQQMAIFNSVLTSSSSLPADQFEHQSAVRSTLATLMEATERQRISLLNEINKLSPNATAGTSPAMPSSPRPVLPPRPKSMSANDYAAVVDVTMRDAAATSVEGKTDIELIRKTSYSDQQITEGKTDEPTPIADDAVAANTYEQITSYPALQPPASANDSSLLSSSKPVMPPRPRRQHTMSEEELAHIAAQNNGDSTVHGTAATQPVPPQYVEPITSAVPTSSSIPLVPVIAKPVMPPRSKNSIVATTSHHHSNSFEAANAAALADHEPIAPVLTHDRDETNKSNGQNNSAHTPSPHTDTSPPSLSHSRHKSDSYISPEHPYFKHNAVTTTTTTTTNNT